MKVISNLKAIEPSQNIFLVDIFYALRASLGGHKEDERKAEELYSWINQNV